MAEDVMTKQQAASYLHISVATLEHWTRAGLLLTGACMATPQSAWLRPIATLAWTRPTETGLSPATFPEACLWTLAQVLDEDFLPEG